MAQYKYNVIISEKKKSLINRALKMKVINIIIIKSLFNTLNAYTSFHSKVISILIKKANPHGNSWRKNYLKNTYKCWSVIVHER